MKTLSNTLLIALRTPQSRVRGAGRYDSRCKCLRHSHLLEPAHRLFIAERHQLVHLVAVALGRSALPLGLLLYPTLEGFASHGVKVVVVGRSPLSPGKGAGPPALRVGGFRGL